MPIAEICKARKTGVIRFNSISQYPVLMEEILEMCGLKPLANKLVEITRDQALKVIERWLHKEPAYNSVLMSQSKARQLAAKFIDEFSDSTTKYYSNARWYDESVTMGTCLSDFIFDGGVLLESGLGNDTHHVCLWFLDED